MSLTLQIVQLIIAGTFVLASITGVLTNVCVLIVLNYSIKLKSYSITPLLTYLALNDVFLSFGALAEALASYRAYEVCLLKLIVNCYSRWKRTQTQILPSHVYNV
jgi:hypothetical protein